MQKQTKDDIKVVPFLHTLKTAGERSNPLSIVFSVISEEYELLRQKQVIDVFLLCLKELEKKKVNPINLIGEGKSFKDVILLSDVKKIMGCE